MERAAKRSFLSARPRRALLHLPDLRLPEARPRDLGRRDLGRPGPGHPGLRHPGLRRPVSGNRVEENLLPTEVWIQPLSVPLSNLNAAVLQPGLPTNNKRTYLRRATFPLSPVRKRQPQRGSHRRPPGPAVVEKAFPSPSAWGSVETYP